MTMPSASSSASMGSYTAGSIGRTTPRAAIRPSSNNWVAMAAGNPTCARIVTNVERNTAPHCKPRIVYRDGHGGVAVRLAVSQQSRGVPALRRERARDQCATRRARRTLPCRAGTELQLRDTWPKDLSRRERTCQACHVTCGHNEIV